MYWNFYMLLRHICFTPIIFWILHIIFFAISTITLKRPGRIFFLIPGALFCIHDLRWEFFNGPVKCSIFFIVIEIILMITGTIILLSESNSKLTGIIDVILTFIQGYMFGVISIIIITLIGCGIVLSIIILIILLIVASLVFS